MEEVNSNKKMSVFENVHFKSGNQGVLLGCSDNGFLSFSGGGAINPWRFLVLALEQSPCTSDLSIYICKRDVMEQLIEP